MTSLSAVLGVAGPWGTWGCCLGARRCAALQEGGLRGLLSPTGLCAPGDLWPAQPVCVTGGFGCALESGGPATLPPPAAVPSRYVLPWPGGPARGAGSRSSWQPGCPAGTFSRPGRGWEPVLTAVQPGFLRSPSAGCCHLPFGLEL